MQKESINKINFNQLATEWLLFKKTKIKESTYLNYKFIIDNRFIIKFGKKTLKELLQYNFNSYIEMLTKTLSSKTVKDTVSVLKGILKYAERKYDINFKLILVSSPSIYKKDIEIFSERERRRIERYCFKSNDIKALGLLMSLCR